MDGEGGRGCSVVPLLELVVFIEGSAELAREYYLPLVCQNKTDPKLDDSGLAILIGSHELPDIFPFLPG